MKSVQKSVLVPHPVERMYALVDRIDDYPKFLPWCGGAQTSQRTPDSVVAEIWIDYHGIQQSFVTRNTTVAPEQIDMHFVSGPFRRLEGHWQFVPVGKLGCRIEFALDYEFASGMLEMLFGPIFDSIANSFVDAFVRRADSDTSVPS